MGRTLPTFTGLIDHIYNDWKQFRRGLRKEDQRTFDRLFESAHLHVQASAYASRPWPLESVFMSILLEHEKKLTELQERFRRLEESLIIGEPDD
jgi:hypothetical protein